MSGLALACVGLVLALLVPDVLLILFASLLVATLLHGGSNWISHWTRLGHGIALALLTIVILLGFVALGVVAAPVMSDQASQLWEQVPRALRVLRTWVEGQVWGPALLGQLSSDGFAKSFTGGTIAGRATSAVTTTFGVFGDLAVICVIGLFLAADPATYRDGIVALIAPPGQERTREVLNQLSQTLRTWMLAQLLSMAVIGLLTTLGLWLLGVPLAVVLGVIAALLTFIPNLGPILAAAPAVLLGFATAPVQGAYVVALYVGVQLVEGNLTTPLIQQRAISLPPALILSSQLLMAELFGLLGLALATPFTAVAIKLVQLLYVQRFLAGKQEHDDSS